MIKKLQTIWEKQPLTLIMFLAIFFRLLAVIFARGWGMFDDHFIVIESSGSWLDGQDYNNWFPGSKGNTGPTGHNLFYPGLHFLLFSVLNWMGVTDPQGKMFVVRLIHAALSLITVYFGYRITDKLEGRTSARLAGLLLALFWFMPWMSVRNLVEMTCIPFLILPFWMMVRKKPGENLFGTWLIAGILFGIAFNIRPQTVFFPIGIGIVILFRKQWKELLALSIGSVFCIGIIQGTIDYFIWGYPFAELLGYINVCITERNDYISLPWFNYFLTITGMLIPPVSLFLFIGFFRYWKKYLLIMVPVVLFFIFHSYFPNKQERFILPMIPFFIIIGISGWQDFISGIRARAWQTRLFRGSWTFFWIVNSILLITMTLTYSKKARVEAMTYLSRYAGIEAIAVVDEQNSPELMPKFYLGQWPGSYNEISKDLCADSILAIGCRPGYIPPGFILFTGDREIRPMVIMAREYYPRIVYETTIEPGMLDRFIHWLNPINKNRRIFIYRNTDVFPEKIEK